MRTWSVRGTAFALCTRSSSLSMSTRTSITRESSFGGCRNGPPSALEADSEPGQPLPRPGQVRDVIQLPVRVLEAGDRDALVAVDLALELADFEHQVGDLQLELAQVPTVTKAPHREVKEREC